MNVVIRANASSEVGLGHVVRCRALARELTARGASCVLVGPALGLAQPTDDDVFAEWIPRARYDGEVADARYLVSVAERASADRLVLDDYRVRVAYQRALLDHGAPPWLQMAPQVGEEIHARWIFNANPSARKSAYRITAQHPHASFLVGPRFALLREEFRDLVRPVRVDGPPVVLVAFGGGDDRGATVFALEALSPLLDRIRLVALLGAANPRAEEIAQHITRYPSERVGLHVGLPEVAPLLLTADIGVLAAGTATFEAAACGLPMVLVPVSDNQEGQALAWQDYGAATALARFGSASALELRTAVEALLDDRDERALRGQRGRALVDGRGTQRVADALLSAV